MKHRTLLVVALMPLVTACSDDSSPRSTSDDAARTAQSTLKTTESPPPAAASGTPLSKAAYQERVCALRAEHLRDDGGDLDPGLASEDDSEVADSLRDLAATVATNTDELAHDLADLVPPAEVRGDHERLVENTWSAHLSFVRAATKLDDHELVREPDPMQRQKWETELYDIWDAYERQGYDRVAAC